MADVLVAIPTFRRPKGLARLLSALARLDTDLSVEILVADNDCDARDGLACCQDIRAEGYRWPIRCVLVPERGIAQARNALVENALGNSDARYIAMLDDDEWPEPGWLSAFLRAQNETGADALHGAVLREFECEPKAWAQRCQGTAPLRHTSGPVDMIHGTSNVFLTRACLARLERPWFDREFGLTGGEDKEFFTRLRKSGARFAWADDAVVRAYVPTSRSTRAWALRRAYRVGNSDMRVFLKHERRIRVRAIEGAKIAAALLVSVLEFGAGLANSATRMVALCHLSRAAGKLAAIFGAHYREYVHVHGD